jgi:hypothetical protein
MDDKTLAGENKVTEKKEFKMSFGKLVATVLASVVITNLTVFTYVKEYGLSNFGYLNESQISLTYPKVVIVDVEQSLQHWGGYAEDFINEKMKQKIVELRDQGYLIIDSTGFIVGSPESHYLLLKPELFGLKNNDKEKVLYNDEIKPEDVTVEIKQK